MIEYIITGIIAYYLTIFLVIYKCDWRSMLGCRGKPPDKSPDVPSETADTSVLVVGKSTFVYQPPPPEPSFVEEKERYSAIDQESLDEAAAEADQEEIEGAIPKLSEEEMYYRYPPDQEDYSSFAAGVAFDDLPKVKTVLTTDDNTEEEERETAIIIDLNRNNSLIQGIISNIPEGEKRVDRILQKHLNLFYQTETDENNGGNGISEEIKNFNINNYIYTG